MSEQLIKPYEISIWEDELTSSGFEEHKLAVIGSDTMTGYNKVYDPVFNKKSNGERTLTFSLKYKYFDPYIGNEEIINPFAALLTNERKVKLHYDGKWYEFIVKEHSEASEDYTWSYTCTDAFVLELAKRGYNITFDAELNNNQGTIRELAEETLKDTEWTIPLDGIDLIKQYVAEPIYKAVLTPTGVNIINASGDGEPVPSESTNIYVFYSYVKNKSGKFVQFIIHDESRAYQIDDKNVITDTNFRITTDLTYDEEAQAFKYDGNTVIQLSVGTQEAPLDPVETRYQANRLVYNQLTTYDPVMQRTVDRFQATKTESDVTTVVDKEVYRYTDYVYTTSNVVLNYITNGENFNILDDGSLQGWDPYTATTGTEIQPLELITRPEIEPNKPLADLTDITQIEGFLKVKFNGAFNNYKNTIFNSGIENNASFVQSISQGQKFVFRWRAGKRNPNESNPDINDVDCLVPVDNLQLIVAKYTKQEASNGGYEIVINPESRILYFTGSPRILNNVVEGGALMPGDEPGKYNYVIDNVIQAPSTKYVYIDNTNNNKYIWNMNENNYEALDEEHYSNYIPYYYLTATAEQAVPNSVISDVTENIGIFVYSIDNNINADNPVYIQDIQLTRFVPDGADDTGATPIVMGNVPTATSVATEYYYVQPDDSTAAEDVITYATVAALKNALGFSEVNALYNENSEKTLSISVSQSNCFDILQTIAETFECWIDLVVGHDDNGYITKTNNKPDKYVYFREYAGKDNWAGFKYGINLNSIERTINSDEFVTKLIVDQAQSDYVDEGFVSIQNAPSNTSGESYILNFEYYYGQGLLDRDTVEADRLNFITEVADINNQLRDKETIRRNLEASLTALGSNRNVFTELVDSAKDMKTDALGDFQKLTGMSYSDYQAKQASANVYSGKFYILTEDTTVKQGKAYYTRSGAGTSQSPYVFTIVSNPTGNPHSQDYYEILPDYTEEDTMYTLLGELYVSSATINNYSGILTNVDQEYWVVRQQLHGTENYSFKIWSVIDDMTIRHLYLELSDYVPGFNFVVEGSTYYSTVSKKFFDIELNPTPGQQTVEIDFTAPNGYTVKNNDTTITSYDFDFTETATIPFKLIADNPSTGVEGEIKVIQTQKDELINEFNNKYGRFIQEGTWNSTDYIDSELYYLDAVQVSNTSAQPTVSYTISVVEVSELENLECYNFDAGDKTYVEDTEFFGWTKINGILTPAREEVIVSEVEWHLDSPDANTITVQNYKTQFDDLFQRISATVQTVQYNEATYAKISSLMDANGTINQDVLIESLNNLAGQEYALTSDGSIIVENDAILIQNLTNTANRVIITSEGIKVSSDGGNTWSTAIDGQGINIGVVYTGSLNTNEVIIGNNEKPSFRWDKSGISAFKEDEDSYDLQTYVRYDQYGLYGIKNNENFKAQSLDDVKDKAHFAVTWDGFFIKNSYEGGGRVEITSDNDFRITKIRDGETEESEVIKIGALEWPSGSTTTTIPMPGVAPSLYGIRITNDDGVETFKTGTDGNIEITGTIHATGGTFDSLVQVGDGDPYIAIDGENALIKTSNFSEGAGAGWMIDAEGNSYFNNITARGAIKTAVFEYAEIQAVGGLFVFRPSSTIRSATLGGDDIIVTVEKPILFKENQWCKVSNYTGGREADDPDVDIDGTYVSTTDVSIDPNKTYYTYNSETDIYEAVEEPDVSEIGTYYELDTQAILNNNGLVNVYEITYIDSTAPYAMTLEGAKAMIDDGIIENASDLVGGALVDMGNENGDSNYGIGINSSDNSANLPARAISLFETEIDNSGDTKVSYNYQAILGTLPKTLSNVDSTVYSKLANTQGIYTDNMYLGDNSQYIAFYTDDNDNKKLSIKAEQIDFQSDGKRIVGNNDGLTITGPVGNNSSGYNILITDTDIKLRDNNNIANAVLDSNGLTLNKGGIVAGEGTQSLVYLSSEDYEGTISLDPTKTNWKQIIGNNFAVDSEGNLYAAAAYFSGLLTLEQGTQFGQYMTFDYQKKLTESEPSDWSINYNSYYIAGIHEDEYEQLNVASAPQWEANTYYENDISNPQLIIGDKAKFAVTIDRGQITFWYNWQKVAFINGAQMEIPKSVMLEEMRVGQDKWSWKKHADDDNLELKWIGGQV